MKILWGAFSYNVYTTNGRVLLGSGSMRFSMGIRMHAALQEIEAKGQMMFVRL
jgi:hypothetical protein